MSIFQCTNGPFIHLWRKVFQIFRPSLIGLFVAKCLVSDPCIYMGKGPLWLGQTYLPQVTGEALRGLEPQRASCFWAQYALWRGALLGLLPGAPCVTSGKSYPVSPIFFSVIWVG